MENFWEVIEACPLQVAYPPSTNNGFVPTIKRAYNSIKHVTKCTHSKRKFNPIFVQMDDDNGFFEKLARNIIIQICVF